MSSERVRGEGVKGEVLKNKRTLKKITDNAQCPFKALKVMQTSGHSIVRDSTGSVTSVPTSTDRRRSASS